MKTISRTLCFAFLFVAFFGFAQNASAQTRYNMDADLKEDVLDRAEDRRVKKEDLRDKKEDYKDRREDKRDRKEAIRDRREDRKDRKENICDRKENRRDRKA